VFTGEELSRAAEAGRDLIEDEQRAWNAKDQQVTRTRTRQQNTAHDVRDHARVLAGEKLSRAAEASRDLIEDEQRAWTGWG